MPSSDTAQHTASSAAQPLTAPAPLAAGELSDADLEAVAAGTSKECQPDQTGSSIKVKRF